MIRRRSRATAPISPRSPRTACCNEFDRQHGRAARRPTSSEFWGERDRAELRGRRRTAPRALPPAVLRPEEFPAHLAQPALRHRRALPVGQPRLRRPRRHLHPSWGAEQPRHLRGPRTRAQRVVALHPPRGRPDVPFRRPRGRAGLQAGGEPVRRPRLQPGRSPSAGIGPASNPMAEQLMLSREQLSPIYQRLQSAGSDRARASTRPKSGGSGRPASRSARGPTATSSVSPRELKVQHRGARGRARLGGQRWCRSPTPSRARASSR